jgi:hypothetical protein
MIEIQNKRQLVLAIHSQKLKKEGDWVFLEL